MMKSEVLRLKMACLNVVHAVYGSGERVAVGFLTFRELRGRTGRR